MMDMQNMQNLIGQIGQKVVCPKCGKEGIVAIDSFKAKGKVYRYLVVRHYVGSKTQRCVLGRLDGQAEDAKPAKPEQEQRESVVLGERELEALFNYSIRKKGYTPEQADTAKQVLHTIVEKGRQAGKVTVVFG